MIEGGGTEAETTEMQVHERKCGVPIIHGVWKRSVSQPSESESCPEVRSSYKLEDAKVVFGTSIILPSLRIQFLSGIATPMFTLTHQDTMFVWTPACENSFKELKRLMSEALLLSHPDFTRDFILETDASGEGRAVPAQGMHG